MRKVRHGTARIELMMTPMIDVVFQLLIFFMLMPSFGTTEGYLPTNLPDVGPGPQEVRPPPSNELRIDLWHVEADRQLVSGAVTISLNRERLSDYRELRAKLRLACEGLAARNVNMDKVPVLIAPDMTVWHKHVVAAFDAAIDAGYRDIRFTVPQ